MLIILGAVQAEIRRQVNNARRQVRELIDFVLGGPVRQGQEKQIHGLDGLGVAEL